jgi:hypothetical protein
MHPPFIDSYRPTNWQSVDLHANLSPQKCINPPPPPKYFPLSPTSSPLKSIKPLISIPNKRQIHLRDMLLAQLLDLHTMHMRVVVLVDLVGREVAAVDVGGQAGLEGRADLAQLLEDDAFEEGVRADVGAAELARGGAEAGGGVAEEAGGCVSWVWRGRGGGARDVFAYFRMRLSARLPSWMSSGK